MFESATEDEVVEIRARDWALTLAAQLGIRCVEHDGMPYTWNGRRLKLSDNPTASGILHEIAHWIVAPKWRRTKPGWGLGPEPSGDRCARTLVTDEFANNEERQASVLGILYERALGLDWWDTADGHQWTERDKPNILFSESRETVLSRDFYMQIAKLNSRGLCQGWMPTIGVAGLR